MKDEKDNLTIDSIPAKRGRPVLDPLNGPMTAAQRVAASRQRKRELLGIPKEIHIPEKVLARANTICQRLDVDLNELVVSLLANTKMPRKERNR